MSAYELADGSWHEPNLGKFPTGWTVRELGSIAEVVTGKKDVNQGSPNGRYPFFTCARAVSWSNTYSFDCEAIMVAGNGDVGNTHYYNGKFEAYQRTYVLSRFVEDTDVRFVYAYLAGNLQADLLLAKTGSTMPYIRKGDLVGYRLPFPPFPEQRRIAAVLNTIQDAIAAQEDVIAAAKEFKRSLMHRLFTVGPGREPAPTKETEIGEIPAHWVLQPLEQLCTHVVDCPHSTPTFLSSGVLVIRNFNIRDGRLDLSDSYYTSEQEYEVRTRRLAPIPGDVLFSREAPIGEACVIPDATKLSLGQRTMLMRPNPKLLDPIFLVYTFYSDNVKQFMSRQGKGVTAKHLNVGDVRSMKIPVPALLSEQLQISAAMKAADDKLAAEEDRLTALQALFKSMLHQLMTGQIRLLSDEGLPLT